MGGGQVGDTGSISIGNQKMDVTDTFRDGGEIVHVLKWRAKGGDPGKLVGANPAVHLDVNRDVRLDTARNHTGTHLLHRALREVLGDPIDVTVSCGVVEWARKCKGTDE